MFLFHTQTEWGQRSFFILLLQPLSLIGPCVPELQRWGFLSTPTSSTHEWQPVSTLYCWWIMGPMLLLPSCGRCLVKISSHPGHMVQVGFLLLPWYRRALSSTRARMGESIFYPCPNNLPNFTWTQMFGQVSFLPIPCLWQLSWPMTEVLEHCGFCTLSQG